MGGLYDIVFPQGKLVFLFILCIQIIQLEWVKMFATMDAVQSTNVIEDIEDHALPAREDMSVTAHM